VDSLAEHILPVARPAASRLETLVRRPNRDAVIAALLSGGDSRTIVDGVSCTNKYLCPPYPADELTCFASCTASPIGHASFERASNLFADIVGARSAQRRAERLAQHETIIEADLLAHFAVAGLAEIILCPSGTDAMLTAARLLAAERPGQAITAILPCAAETGTGVPYAVACRRFDGPDTGAAVADVIVETVEIPLRTDRGEPRTEAAINDAFAEAASSATGRPVVYLTYGTKTGLIAPVLPPAGAEIIVDACQARISPQTVAAYIARGWPVVITGSKFFGGPAFSGAVLFPRGRWKLASRPPARANGHAYGAGEGGATLGTVMRWAASVAVIEAFQLGAAEMAGLLRDHAASVQSGLASLPGIIPVGGMLPRGSAWPDLPSIFTFAVRDPEQPARLLTAAELRPLYLRLAKQGVLLGQPVGLGPFGGLRIAIGARDLIDARGVADLSRVFDVLRGGMGANEG
jgi:hypothetical protein